MKKLLALVLALVMSMSLVTISNADFKDADEIDYTEAVEVLNAVGVLAGSDGKFNPKAELTRSQACKIIAYLDLGAKAADAIKGSGEVFTDVPATAWYAGYVEYCAGAGYVSGVGDGKFAPDAKVTGVQFAKMLLCALGYQAEAEGYNGDNWSLSIARDANKIDLFDGLNIATSANLTREQAAQMALNALEATCVKYSGGTNVSTSDGTKVTVNATRSEELDNGFCYLCDNKGTCTADEHDTMQLCEKLYKGDIVKSTDSSDKFGRPATSWEYDNDPIGDYAEEPIAVYAGADYDEDVTEDLEDDYSAKTWTFWYNGMKETSSWGHGYAIESKSAYTYPKDTKSILEEGLNGVTIEVYEDPADEDALIFVTIEGYVAQIDEINTDDDDEVTSVDISVYEANYVINEKGAYSITVDAEKNEDAYALIKDFEEDEYFIIVTTGTPKDMDVDEDLLAVDTLKSVKGTVTATKLDKYYNGWIKIDGVKYEMANNYSQASVKVDDEGTFYLYNGYVMTVDVESDDDDAYLFVVRGGAETNKWGSDTYYAEVVFADGTCKTIELDDEGVVPTKADGKDKYSMTKGIYSYEVDDDVYKLTESDKDSETVTINKGQAKVGDKYTANSKTVYVNVKLDEGKFDSAKVYTGYKAVPTMESATVYVVADKSGVLEYVFSVDATAKDEAETYVYVVYGSVSGKITEKVGDDEINYYTYDAVVDGEIVEIKAEKNDLKAGLYESFEIDENGIYENFTAATEKTDYWTISKSGETVNFKKAADDVVTVTDKDGKILKALPYADDVTVYVVDDDEVKTGSINKNYTGYTSVLYLTEDGEFDDVTCIYIVK